MAVTPPREHSSPYASNGNGHRDEGGHREKNGNGNHKGVIRSVGKRDSNGGRVFHHLPKASNGLKLLSRTNGCEWIFSFQKVPDIF